MNLNERTVKRGLKDMGLKFMYITNSTDVARVAEKYGVDWIFVDLEVIGKEERQGHLDTVMSCHEIGDIPKIKQAISKSRLMVRVNPIHEGSREEIDQVIAGGAEIVMLPFFKTKEEVESFLGFVDGRAETCLLLETPEAVECIDEILELDDIDYIHIGLNDLHIGYGMKFMFEPLADGTVDMLCSKIAAKGIPYGIGGIARPGNGMLPAELIITEHYRLGSSMVILSRKFCNSEKVKDIEKIEEIFREGIESIREYEEFVSGKDESFFAESNRVMCEKVGEIVAGCSSAD